MHKTVKSVYAKSAYVHQDCTKSTHAIGKHKNKHTQNFTRLSVATRREIDTKQLHREDQPARNKHSPTEEHNSIASGLAWRHCVIRTWRHASVKLPPLDIGNIIRYGEEVRKKSSSVPTQSASMKESIVFSFCQTRQENCNTCCAVVYRVLTFSQWIFVLFFFCFFFWFATIKSKTIPLSN